jgi:uncharacterized delta-60 repeat protein
VALAAAAAALAAPAPAGAGIGDLDPAFDNDGKRTGPVFDGVVKVALQPDGKIVAVGPVGGFNPTAAEFTVVRLNPDGSLDMSFDGDGVATTDFGAIDRSSAVAIQPDGKIVVAGVTGDALAGDDFAVARYNSDGSPDMGFSDDGKQTTDVSSGGGDAVNTLLIQPDGRILAAGYGARDPNATQASDFALARYLTDGKVDATHVTEFGTTLGSGIAGVSLLPDGKVLAGGSVGDLSVSDFALARYNEDLSPDNDFGGGGTLTSEIGSGTYETAFGMTTQPDGKVVLVGEVGSDSTAPRDIALARFDTSGVPDPSFDGDGKLALDIGPPSSAQGVVVQPDGKLVVAGRLGAGTSLDFALVRLEQGGAPDPSFATNGLATADFGSSDYANSVARGEDGMLLVSGSNGFGPAPAAFARFVGAPPETTITSGPSGPTNDATPSFAFASNVFGASVDCLIGGGPFAPCASPFTAGPLADGSYAFEARARDASGTLDPTPASLAFSVDTVAPDTTIVSGPSGGTRDRTPTFEFSSSEAGAHFECSLDDAAFGACASPYTTAPLSAGRHTFQVRAVDPVGNADPTPADVVDPGTGQRGFEVVDRPTLGRDFNLEVLSGEVYVSVPGPEGRTAGSAAQRRGPYRSPIKGRSFVPVEQVRQIPVGSFVDTRFGRGRITTTTDRASRRLQSGSFAAGVFQVLQSRSRRARGLTELRLKGSSFGKCRAGTGKTASAALSRAAIRRLRSSASGRYRTSGRYSSATVRGTVWETIDRCDGTLTKVRRGRVVVRDFRLRKNVVVRAGKSYLAKAPR